MKRFFVLLLISLFFSVAYCQQEPEKCPFGGREDCTGYCGLFTDENEDGFCDYSILTNQKNEQEELFVFFFFLNFKKKKKLK